MDARLEIEYITRNFGKLASPDRTSIIDDLVEMIRTETTSFRKFPVASERFQNGMHEACNRVEEKLSEKYGLGMDVAQPRFVRITPSVRLTPRRKQAPKPEPGAPKLPKNRLR